jgi:hypothetical protein
MRPEVQTPVLPKKNFLKKNKGNEPVQDIIHKYMEMSQGNSLCSYLKQKCYFFFFYKIREQEGRIGPVWGGW